MDEVGSPDTKKMVGSTSILLNAFLIFIISLPENCHPRIIFISRLVEVIEYIVRQF